MLSLSLVAVGRATPNPDGTFSAEGIGMTSILSSREPGVAGALCDFLALVTWDREDVGDHMLTFRTLGAAGVVQEEPHPFRIKEGTQGKGAYIATFAAKVPHGEPFLRVEAALDDQCRHWTLEMST